MTTAIALLAIQMDAQSLDTFPQGQSRGGEQVGKVYKTRIIPSWFDENNQFWYRNDLRDNRTEYVLVDAVSGTRKAAFDHQRLTDALRKWDLETISQDRLEIDDLEFEVNGSEENGFTFRGYGSRWRCDLETYELDRKEKELGGPANNGTARVIANPRHARGATGEETSIRFLNELDEAVELFWIADGRRQQYGVLKAGESRDQHTFAGHVWETVTAAGKTVAFFEAMSRPSFAAIKHGLPVSPPRSNRRGRSRRASSLGESTSPDGKWKFAIENGNVLLTATDRDAEPIVVTQDGSNEVSYGMLQWSPDSQSLIAYRITPGDEKSVHLIESSPKDFGRAKLSSNVYPLPGDDFTLFELTVIPLETQQPIKPDVDPIDFGYPNLHWHSDQTHFTYTKVDRGHQRLRLIEVDSITGGNRTVVDEQSDTFIWTAHAEGIGTPPFTWLDKSDEVIYSSEKDGWRHLYLVDLKTGQQRAITQGDWVVRGVDQFDEQKRQIWFRASGLYPEQDPYFIHFCRINFDGTGFVALTEGDGTHSIEYSPDRRFLIDSYSRVDMGPVHELRNSEDGKLICRLESADISELEESDWSLPEVFVAKGRDGQTDIWGIICRPADFDPDKKYPIIEDIYAGPHDAFVPKQFSASPRYRDLCELGFIVVKIDGMGTAHRSKAFHDVCWHNLKDAGFPDRIEWIKAAAQKYPSMDATRVGIYGTSAGGQNAAGAVVFHGDFYKAAVASCGCHDNRMDKASWNEQWMGYPVGPQYADCSNIDNANRLTGNLMLIVGELDNNVPPESTMRFVDALIKADKDFDLLVIPGMGHSDGGSYGRRRRNAFFKEHLQSNRDKSRVDSDAGDSP